MCGSGSGGKIVIPDRFYPLGASLSYVGAETKATEYEGWNSNSGNYLFTTDTK